MAYPTLVPSGRRTFVSRYLLLSILLLAFTVPAIAAALDTAPGTVRIRLLENENPENIEISAPEGDLHFIAGNDTGPFLVLSAGMSVEVTSARGEVYIKTPEGNIYASSLRIQPQSTAPFTLKHTSDDTTWERSYQGSLEITAVLNAPTRLLKLVNEVDLEDYVASVLSSEYTLDDREGARAMAVIIRTYALQGMAQQGATYDHVDHTRAQVYRGVDKITPGAREAALSTAGQVLTYRNDLIEAVYSSSSGGHTADNEDVWYSDPKPYLRGKPDPFDNVSPHASWSSEVPRKALLAVLSDAYDHDVEGFKIKDRSRDGRVQTVELLSAKGMKRNIKANEFRLNVIRNFGSNTLKSTLFKARLRGDTYYFEGQGYGHGVGLSQWGAYEMARRGNSYEEILSYYYADVKLVNRETLQPMPSTLASTTASPQPDLTSTREEPSQPVRTATWTTPPPTATVSDTTQTIRSKPPASVVSSSSAPAATAERKATPQKTSTKKRRKGW